MTNQEAIEILKNDGCENCLYQFESPIACTMEDCEVKIAHLVAIEALEKQTPKEPNYVYEDEPLCPYCGAVLDDCESPCENCNQFIDWREE